MADWATQQDHHGVRPQMIVIHIYKLIYKHFISSVLCQLKEISKQMTG